MEVRRERNIATMVKMRNRSRSVTLKYECKRPLGKLLLKYMGNIKSLSKYDMKSWSGITRFKTETNGDICE